MALAAGFMRTDLNGGGVILWDARRHTRLTDRPMAVAGGGNVFGVAFSPDGSTVAGDFRRHPLISGVVLWDARRGVQLAERALEDGKSLSRVVFSPDGKTLAGGYGYDKAEDGTDGGVALWDARGLAPVTEKALTIADRSVTSVAFSPDGSIIAATCRRWPGPQDGGVMLWDARSGLRMVDGLQDVAEGSEGELAFSPDGRTLAVEYSDDRGRGVVLWDVPLRRRLGKRPLEVAEGDVTRLTFSPDGKTLAAGFRNIGFRAAGRISRGGVVLFDIDPESWKERAGRIANRNLTRAEWREYLPDTPYRATFTHLPPPPDDESGPLSSPATGAKGASADKP
jgi:WD40 repeat protein